MRLHRHGGAPPVGPRVPPFWFRTDDSGVARSRRARQLGLTLTELLIAIALGLSLLAAATALLVGVKNSYQDADDSARINDTGRHAMTVIGRAIRQAGHQPRESDRGMANASVFGAPHIRIAGVDNIVLGADSADWNDAASKSAVNGSDALVTRFFGSGEGVADGAIVNCAGVAIAAPASPVQQPAGSAFFVANSNDGEPELRCKYLAADGRWASSPIARGVESFQAIYGIDSNGDGLPERFVAASQLDQVQWNSVVAVRIGLLVRGTHRGSLAAPETVYHLFGPWYSAAFPGDVGVQPSARQLGGARQRRLFQRTFWLDNREGT